MVHHSPSSSHKANSLPGLVLIMGVMYLLSVPDSVSISLQFGIEVVALFGSMWLAHLSWTLRHPGLTLIYLVVAGSYGLMLIGMGQTSWWAAVEIGWALWSFGVATYLEKKTLAV